MTFSRNEFTSVKIEKVRQVEPIDKNNVFGKFHSHAKNNSRRTSNEFYDMNQMVQNDCNVWFDNIFKYEYIQINYGLVKSSLEPIFDHENRSKNH